MTFLAIILTGLLGIVIYPTVLFGVKFPELGFLAWFFLIPLFLSFLKEKPRFFLSSFGAAFIFYTGSLYWLVNAMKNFGGLGLYEAIGVLLLIVIILSLYWGVSASLAGFVSRLLNIPLFITLPLFLVTMDFARTYFPVNGFPWAMPAYSQGSFLDSFEWVDITGVFGLGFFIYFINALLADMLVHVMRRQREGMVVRSALLVLVLVLSIFTNLTRKASMFDVATEAKGVNVGLIQGNIAQDIKWNVHVARENLEKHLRLTDKAMVEGAELAIWPETAYPFTVNLGTDTDLPYLFARGRVTLPVSVYLGAVSVIEKDILPTVYNSAFYLNKAGQIGSMYHKRHLVPFGEYIPMKDFLSFARRLTVAVGDFTPGDKANVVDHAPLKMGTLICYEDIFTDLARTQVMAGANVLVNMTNDAWYGNTSAPYQHLVFSQMRALENRRYLLRATNTGLTAVINPHGTPEAVLKPFSEGYLLGTVYGIELKSFYSQHGDWLAWLCVMLSSLGFVAALLMRVMRKTASSF